MTAVQLAQVHLTLAGRLPHVPGRAVVESWDVGDELDEMEKI
jgi:hypothetical protein